MKEGFETMKQGLDLAEYAMAGYLGVFVYVLFGAVATVIIQSSSATMAIIITALATGQIDYINALALAITTSLALSISQASHQLLAVCHRSRSHLISMPMAFSMSRHRTKRRATRTRSRSPTTLGV